jgi:transposase
LSRFHVEHLIENFFCKLKQFRAIATRYDKTARNFLAAVYLAGELFAAARSPGAASAKIES